MFVGCKCVCDKHPACCSRQNFVLGSGNAPLPGNTFKEVPSVTDCCNLCTQHPHCESWEYSTQRVCVLKAGRPEFVPLDADLRLRMATWAGPRGGGSCAGPAFEGARAPPAPPAQAAGLVPAVPAGAAAAGGADVANSAMP